MQKNVKFLSAGGFAPKPHWPPATGDSAPTLLKHPPPPLRISGYLPGYAYGRSSGILRKTAVVGICKVKLNFSANRSKRIEEALQRWRIKALASLNRIKLYNGKD